MLNTTGNKGAFHLLIHGWKKGWLEAAGVPGRADHFPLLYCTTFSSMQKIKTICYTVVAKMIV